MGGSGLITGVLAPSLAELYSLAAMTAPGATPFSTPRSDRPSAANWPLAGHNLPA
jgi:hypothetical protein